MLILGLFMFAIQFDDHHTYGNSSEVRPTHLSLDLELDFQEKKIKGSCALSLEYASSTETPQYLDLDINAMKILSVKAGDASLVYDTDLKRGYMGERLRIHLAGARPEKVVVSYITDPSAGAVQWLEPQQTTSKKHPFLFTQSQSILARTWIPCMDSPGIRVTFDATIRVPKGLTAVMGAEHGTHAPEQGIFRFNMPLAIPPYLIALAAGELSFKAISDRTGVYAEPAVLEKAAWEFADMERMVQAAEKLAGKYRWGRWDTIVLPPSFPFGGMENPLLTFATPTIIAGDRSLVSLMAHELAHSWSGNLVTNATWADFWLNEGFTTYFERRIVEELYGEDVARMQKLLGQRDLYNTVADFEKNEPGFNVLFIDLKGRDPDDGFSDIPYEKGANFLLMLETHFGRKTFDVFLRKYFDGHAFQSITTDVFKAFLDKELFKGDKALWAELKVDEWIYKGGIPSNLVVPHSDKFAKTKAAAKAFMDSGDLSGVKKDAWVTAEWLDFLNNLPREMPREKMDFLDKTFHFTQAGNSEILFAWLEHCIRNNYEPAFGALEDFLTRQGRRKFLKPLYKAMQENPETREMGRKIYKKARPGYHPISSGTIDAIVK